MQVHCDEANTSLTLFHSLETKKIIMANNDETIGSERQQMNDDDDDEEEQPPLPEYLGQQDEDDQQEDGNDNIDDEEELNFGALCLMLLYDSPDVIAAVVHPFRLSSCRCESAIERKQSNRYYSTNLQKVPL